MTWIVMAFVVLLATVFQTALPAVALFGTIRFPLLLSIVLYYALNRNRTIWLTAALTAGVVHDALSGVPLGYSSAVYVGLAWIASGFRKVVDTEAVVTYAVMGLIGSACVTLVMYLLLARAGLVVDSFWRGLWRTVGAGLLGLICVPTVFLAVHGMDRAVGNVEIKENVNGLG